MGCGCSSGGEGKGLSASEIKDETVTIINKYTDKFIDDFEADLEPKLQAKGAKDITDEDSLDIEDCKKMREELFESQYKERSEKLPDDIMEDVRENLMPEIEEGLPESEMVRKIALKTAITVIDTTVEQTLKATFNDMKDPPFFDRRLRGKLIVLVEGEFGAAEEAYNALVDKMVKDKGVSGKDDLEKDVRKNLMNDAAKDLDRTPIEERINKEVQAKIMPDIEKKMSRRGLEKGGFKARAALMVVNKAIQSTIEQTLKGYLKGLAKKDAAMVLGNKAAAAGAKMADQAQKYGDQAKDLEKEAGKYR